MKTYKDYCSNLSPEARIHMAKQEMKIILKCYDDLLNKKRARQFVFRESSDIMDFYKVFIGFKDSIIDSDHMTIKVI